MCILYVFILYILSYISCCRESIALSAGWALGLILLCKGNSHTSHTSDYTAANTTNTGTNPSLFNTSPPATSAAGDNPPLYNTTTSTSLSGLADLHIEDRLYTLITGGKRPDLLNTYTNTNSTNIYNTTTSNSNNVHDSSSKSSRVLESDFLNVDVTAVGAIIALSLIFMRYTCTIILYIFVFDWNVRLLKYSYHIYTIMRIPLYVYYLYTSFTLLHNYCTILLTLYILTIYLRIHT